MYTFSMLRRLSVFVALIACTSSFMFAQTLQRVDPLEAGFAGSTTGRTGSAWFVHQNPASLASLQSGVLLGCFSPSALGIEDYKEGAFIGGAVIGESVQVGLSGAAFGSGEYREAAGGIVGAAQIEKHLSVGATLLLQSVSIQRYGSSVIPLFDIGVQVQVSPKATFGASFINTTRSAITDQDIPQRLAFGFGWTPDSMLSLSLDVIQELRRDLGFAFGIELEPLKNLSLRAGMGSEPSTVGFGLGFRTDNVIVDYGGSYVDPLGLRHVFGAGITW